jgi:toxin-antitoxin system PIN domain toxin
MLAVDTNVLVYAHRREALEHPEATRVVRELAEGQIPWAIPWPCVYEFFSVVTNSRIWRERATPPPRAWEQLEAWLASPALCLLGETEDFPAVLARFLRHPRVRGPVVHDARVAALCVAHGVTELLTRDRDFSLFGDLSVRNPFG